ncbi:uncharacterized protein LOC106637132 [Copidosoma floridanum]|uniref:uncharacterized protein LOC106637132 n=1 Tax=Copidosoma floridanum TaxID=29053 RepID=UPI0006C9D2A1|nr:uncharacterized protein LOC106637132 [Copidosoma floridanum]
MNDINSSILHAKFQEILPNLPSNITPEVLNKLCKDDCVQPFLKWFHANIKIDNVLSDDDIKLKTHIEQNDSWLQGNELDAMLEEATRDCPELLKLIESDYWSAKQSFADLASEKELYDADVEYLQNLEDSIKKLKEQEDKIDCQIDEEDDVFKKEEAKIKVIYENCISVLEDLDNSYRQFFKAVELLSSSYINDNQKKEESCLWTQMPIELYIKQLESYNDYLSSYANRQFSAPLHDRADAIDENYASFISDNGENDKLKELLTYQQNIFTSKMHEIVAKSEDEANKNLIKYVSDLYGDGCLKVPSTPVVARSEIAELTKTRDFLEENIYQLQECKLVDTVQKFSRARIVKIYKEEAEARLEKKRNRFLRLERLCTYATEHGHAFSTLLCMLFELQIHRINEIINFVIDARHYLTMEYSLSSMRIESMQKLQNEYTSALTSPKDKNTFCRLFTEMTTIMDSQDDLQSSILYYDELRSDNNSKLEILLEKKLNEIIQSSEVLEKKVVDIFNEEIIKSSTLSFSTIPCEVQDKMDTTTKQVQLIETNVESIKNKLKNMIKETNKPSFEREKLMLWKKFLAHPESLKTRCEELKDIEERIKF